MKRLAILLGLLLSVFESNATTVPDAGLASWYGEDHRGKKTANGERFNPDLLTCATWRYAFGQKLRVTNVDTGKSVVVRCNDRGPNKRFTPRRCIDLSAAAFKAIADPKKGLVRVTVQPL
jgi:rare lipoprotein A